MRISLIANRFWRDTTFEHESRARITTLGEGSLMTSACPPTETLSAWLDDELDASEALLIRRHVESCAPCREQVLGWVEVVSEAGSKGSRVRGLKVLLPHFPGVPVAWPSEDDRNRIPSPAHLSNVGVAMAWQASDGNENKVPSPTRVPSVGEGQGEGDRAAGIFEGEGRGEGATTCLDEETLVAYSEAELTAVEAARAEQHLQQCTHCVSEVQRLTHLRAAMESPQKAETSSLASEGLEAAAPLGETQPLALRSRLSPAASRRAPARENRRFWYSAGVRAQEMLSLLRHWLESIGRIQVQPWPALGAVAATALLVLVVVRFLPGRADVQFRGIPGPLKVQITTDSAIARARPSDAEPLVATLGRGTQATRLAQSGEWTRIELPDGRRVWVRSAEVSDLPLRPLPESLP
jgi:anti-sigma factor RsiW